MLHRRGGARACGKDGTRLEWAKTPDRQWRPDDRFHLPCAEKEKVDVSQVVVQVKLTVLSDAAKVPDTFLDRKNGRRRRAGRGPELLNRLWQGYLSTAEELFPRRSWTAVVPNIRRRFANDSRTMGNWKRTAKCGEQTARDAATVRRQAWRQLRTEPGLGLKKPWSCELFAADASKPRCLTFSPKPSGRKMSRIRGRGNKETELRREIVKHSRHHRLAAGSNHFGRSRGDEAQTFRADRRRKISLLTSAPTGEGGFHVSQGALDHLRGWLLRHGCPSTRTCPPTTGRSG